jgi:hypothetical protein
LTVVRVSTSFNSISPITVFFDEINSSSTMRCLR